MIQEAYCSKEVAKLLKEKGFDEPCMLKYYTDGSFDKSILPYKNSEINKDAYCAPTHQMALAWLREVHNISIEPFVDFGYGDKYWWSADIAYIKKNGLITELSGYKSYEETVESALKYVLENLI